VERIEQVLQVRSLSLGIQQKRNTLTKTSRSSSILCELVLTRFGKALRNVLS